MKFNIRFIMGAFAFLLMGAIFSLLIMQSQHEEVGQNPAGTELLPALSPRTSRISIDLPPEIRSQLIKGTVNYINFWANWCPPCLEEKPILNQFKNEYSKQGLNLIMVNLDDLDLLEDYKKSLGVKALPYHMLIDREGNLATGFYKSLVNYQSEFRLQLQQLLDEKASL